LQKEVGKKAVGSWQKEVGKKLVGSWQKSSE